jgi:hypothetical protein
MHARVMMHHRTQHDMGTSIAGVPTKSALHLSRPPCLLHPSLLECGKNSGSGEGREAHSRKASRNAHPLTAPVVRPNTNLLRPRARTTVDASLDSAVNEGCEQESRREAIECNRGSLLVGSDDVVDEDKEREDGLHDVRALRCEQRRGSLQKLE